MNCRQFHDLLYEYVEGSLSAETQAAAGEHVAGCHGCRQAVRHEQQCAQFLCGHLQQDIKTLALHPEVRRHILAVPRPNQESIPSLWNRFAWPAGIAASGLLVAAILLINHSPAAPLAVSIEDSYRVPVCKFHQEGNLIVDTVSYETIVASETLWTTKPTQEKQGKKTPL
jgi:hypothetical protein